jgi:hypothetical protein
MRERPLSSVPIAVVLLLAAALCAQIGLHVRRPPPQPRAQDLTPPPSLPALRIASLGEPVALAKLLMLDLQAFDKQPGVSLLYRDMNYSRLSDWLTRILQLDPRAQYPLFIASRVYGEVPDEARQRIMLDFVYCQFLLDPNLRWAPLAHAAVIAKHRLHDLPLARHYAQALRVHATGNDVPAWARQMEIFLLEDMNEIDSAKILLGGLLQSGQITDLHEAQFLKQKLDELEHRTGASR